MESKQFNVRLPAHVIRRLRVCAAARELTPSQYVMWLLTLDDKSKEVDAILDGQEPTIRHMPEDAL